MQRIHIDYVQIGYTFKVDQSNFNEDTNSYYYHRSITEFFASFGLPEEIISDNGPQFVATEFVTFCRRNGIKTMPTPP